MLFNLLLAAPPPDPARPPGTWMVVRQDLRACAAHPTMAWCGAPPPVRAIADERAEIDRVSARANHLFRPLPAPERVDRWDTHRQALDADLPFDGDCDDLVLTELDELAHDGWPLNRLYRLVVPGAPEDHEAHMVGLAVLADGRALVVGDTRFPTPYPLARLQDPVMAISRLDVRSAGQPAWRITDPSVVGRKPR